jgi:hypothetical protein
MNDPRAHSLAVALPVTEDASDDAPLSERRLVARSGASVSLVEGERGAERIQVRDAQARLVFELDPATGRTVLTVPAGDLTLAASGNVELVAGGALRLRGGEVLDLSADRGRMRFQEATLDAGRVSATVTDARMVIDRLETAAGRIFESARSVFRKIEDLHQVRAGRSRTVVDGGYYVKSGHAAIEAEAEMKIDGKTVHLG